MIFIQDTNRVVINSPIQIDLHRSKVKVAGTIACFLKVKSYHKTENIFIFCVDTSLYALSNETIKTGANRGMTSQKIH